MSTPAPAIDAIIATRDRRDLLLGAIGSILAQDYAGAIRLTVVFDQAVPDPTLERTGSRRNVRVVGNARTPGLAGGRNTGLLLAEHPLVAFCDDDDQWRPGKLAAQVAAIRHSGARACVTGIAVHVGATVRHRVPAADRISHDDLLRSRMTGAHPSSYLIDRRWLLEQVGLVDEEIPFGYGEDFDLLLRCAARQDVAVVPEALVDVLWHSGSFFSQRWAGMAAGLTFLQDKHPALSANRRGRAWIEGQRAFALAAAGGDRHGALSAAGRSMRSNALEPRAVLAAAVALGLLKPDRIMHTLNSRGRGV